MAATGRLWRHLFVGLLSLGLTPGCFENLTVEEVCEGESCREMQRRNTGGRAGSMTGGQMSMAGAPGEGGTPMTGGTPAMGGIPPMGGTPPMGGAQNMGGIPAMGGTPNPGGIMGEGGVEMPGGMMGEGGVEMPGGMMGEGGVEMPGGMMGEGGVEMPGGMMGEGGADEDDNTAELINRCVDEAADEVYLGESSGECVYRHQCDQVGVEPATTLFCINQNFHRDYEQRISQDCSRGPRDGRPCFGNGTCEGESCVLPPGEQALFELKCRNPQVINIPAQPHQIQDSDVVEFGWNMNFERKRDIVWAFRDNDDCHLVPFCEDPENAGHYLCAENQQRPADTARAFNACMATHCGGSAELGDCLYEQCPDEMAACQYPLTIGRVQWFLLDVPPSDGATVQIQAWVNSVSGVAPWIFVYPTQNDCGRPLDIIPPERGNRAEVETANITLCAGMWGYGVSSFSYPLSPGRHLLAVAQTNFRDNNWSDTNGFRLRVRMAALGGADCDETNGIRNNVGCPNELCIRGKCWPDIPQGEPNHCPRFD